MGLIKSDSEYKKELWKLFIGKLIYYAIFLVMPFLLTDYSIWQILLGFFIMHFTCGLVLAVIFQLAHVVEDTNYPLPDDAGQLENNWAIHQLYTTADFAGRNKLLTWYAGGLNYQVEHHLFPTVCHIHYAKIAKIVKETAQEFNLPYNSYPTFLQALSSHTKMLYNLGRA
jgi:linoleoyl-CoA desaturase